MLIGLSNKNGFDQQPKENGGIDPGVENSRTAEQCTGVQALCRMMSTICSVHNAINAPKHYLNTSRTPQRSYFLAFCSDVAEEPLSRAG